MTAQKATEEVAATVVDVVERRPRSVCSGAKYFYLGIVVLRRKRSLSNAIMEETVGTGRRRKRHFLLLYSFSPPRPLFLPISSPELYCIHLSPPPPPNLTFNSQHPFPVLLLLNHRRPIVILEKKSGCGDGAHIVRLRGGERERPDVK